MLILRSNTLNPHFNLATEEYLFKNRKDDLIFLYRNHPSLIIGKHQNALAEINLQFVKKHNIPVIRRLSGGGTVYHDEGNINFCFIRNGTEGHLVNFREFTRPILEFLQTKGLNAELGEKNELRIHQLKFSGNAEHLVKNRIMHHGTILFSSNLQHLEEAIHVDLSKYQDKAVKSNRMTVCNLQSLLSEELDANEFMLMLGNFLSQYFSNPIDLILNTEEINIIQNLVQTKYQTKEWNFGYSPMYLYEKSAKIGKVNIRINLSAQQSMIQSVNLQIDSFEKDAIIIQNLFIGKQHDPETLLHMLESQVHLSLWKEIDPKSLVDMFF